LLLFKKNVLGNKDLTQKQQDHARTLPKGIYVENIMSKVRILRSAITISPTLQTDALSDINIDSPPDIRWEPKNSRPKHVQKNPMSPQKNCIARQKNLSQQEEGDTDEQYNPPE
jgi:hypothetical protein